MMSNSEELVLREIFPTMRQSKFQKINLTSFILDAYTQNYSDAKWENRLFDKYQKKNDCITYGGWLENTEEYYSKNDNCYLHVDKKYIHLGVDVHARYMTPVFTPVACELVEIFHDKDTNGGWGTRITVKSQGHDSLYILYAHLMRRTCFNEGDFIPANECLGFIGRSPFNGASIQHLHLQVVQKEVYESISDTKNNNDLDGYAKKSEKNLDEKYPDPLKSMGRLMNL